MKPTITIVDARLTHVECKEKPKNGEDTNRILPYNELDGSSLNANQRDDHEQEQA